MEGGHVEELEPVTEETAVVMAADEMCQDSAWEDACVRRVPELEDIEDDHEFHRWQDFLEELDEMDARAMADDLAECTEYMDGAGWIEDTHGGAVYVEYR